MEEKLSALHEFLLLFAKSKLNEKYILKEGCVVSENHSAKGNNALVFVPKKKMITDKVVKEFLGTGMLSLLESADETATFGILSSNDAVKIQVLLKDVHTGRPDEIAVDDVKIQAYNAESLLADKTEKICSGKASEEDVSKICDLSRGNIEKDTFNAAMVNVFVRRGTSLVKSDLINAVKRYCFDAGVTGDEMNALFSAVEQYHPSNYPLPDVNIQLTLVRHGADDPRYVGGWSQCDLTKTGVKQARSAREKLEGHFDVFLSSDLLRAQKTAEIINEKLNMQIVYAPEFRETNNGIFANMTAVEFQARPDKIYFADLAYEETYPQGESPKTFFDRIYRALCNLLEKYKNKSVLLVTHGGVMTVMDCIIYAYPYSNKLKIAPDNCEIRAYRLGNFNK